MKSQIFIQKTGTKIAIGIKGPKEHAEKLHNRIFNFGGTDGDLHTMSENFSYFMAPLDNVLKALAWGIIQKKQLRGTGEKGNGTAKAAKRRRAFQNGRLSSKNFFENCLEMARKEVATWKAANFLPENAFGLYFHRELSGGSPDWESEHEG